MKPTTRTTQELRDEVDLNDKVMEDAAADDSQDLLEPETVPGNDRISAWDESEDEAGHRVESEPAVKDETIAEQLVDAGNDEAGEEQRLSAALNKPEDGQR
jgi:hypothetical protein